MLNSLLRRFAFVRSLEARNLSIAHEMMEKLDEAEEKWQRQKDSLEIERSKRIAAEQVAVAREGELEWLRGEYAKAQQSRDEAIAWQMQVIEEARQRQAVADAPPSKEQMSQWQAIPKRNRQAVPMVRRAQHDLINGLRKQEAAKTAAATIKPPMPENVQ